MNLRIGRIALLSRVLLALAGAYFAADAAVGFRGRSKSWRRR